MSVPASTRKRECFKAGASAACLSSKIPLVALVVGLARACVAPWLVPVKIMASKLAVRRKCWKGDMNWATLASCAAVRRHQRQDILGVEDLVDALVHACVHARVRGGELAGKLLVLLLDLLSLLLQSLQMAN